MTAKHDAYMSALTMDTYAYNSGTFRVFGVYHHLSPLFPCLCRLFTASAKLDVHRTYVGVARSGKVTIPPLFALSLQGLHGVDDRGGPTSE
jgi:hypothetical protein